MPSTGTPSSKIRFGGAGLCASWTLAGPPDRITAFGAKASRMARSEEHTSELQSLMRISYAVFCLKKKKKKKRYNMQKQIIQDNSQQDINHQYQYKYRST